MPGLIPYPRSESSKGRDSKKTNRNGEERRERENRKPSKKRVRDDEAETRDDSQLAPSPAKRPKNSARSTTEYKLPAFSRAASSSPIIQQTASLYLPLSPVYQAYTVKGLCAEHLSPLILTYYSPLDGVVLSYRNVRVSEAPPPTTGVHDESKALDSTGQPMPLTRSIDEYAVSFAWVTVDFLLLRLQKGMYLDAAVNLQNESHLGLLVWNLFSTSIDKNRIPRDWEWRGAGSRSSPRRINGAAHEFGEEHVDGHEGYFVDGGGEKVGGRLSFRLLDWNVVYASETDRGHLVLEGSLLSEEQNCNVDEEAREVKHDARLRRRNG